MNDLFKCIVKWLVLFLAILALFIIGFGIALLLFPKVLLTALRYVLAGACLFGGLWLIAAIVVSFIKSKMDSVSEKKQLNEAY